MLYSPNMLKTYSQCPKKYFYKYVKNISMPVNDDIFETGKNIHALASYFLKKENIYKLEQSLSEKEKKVWEYLKQVKYFSYDVIGTEYSLNVRLNEYFFSGRLDALLKNDNKYYILDYKTGSAPKNAKYNYQTMVYLLLVAKYFKTTNVVFVYLDLKNESETKIELTDESIIEYEKKLSEIVIKINENDFDFNLKSCPCEYSIICYH